MKPYPLWMASFTLSAYPASFLPNFFVSSAFFLPMDYREANELPEWVKLVNRAVCLQAVSDSRADFLSYRFPLS